MFQEIFLAFIPIFVAVDCIGTLPIFVMLTQDLDPKEKGTVTLQSMFTAIGLAIGFIFLGKAVFNLLGITVADFMIAGGALLFCLAIIDLVNPGKERLVSSRESGVVPLGTPLIVGPAVLTTSLLLLDQHGVVPTVAAVLLNILLTGLVFSCSDALIKIIGHGGARAMSKVTALLLSAIGVMMVRRGIIQIMTGQHVVPM